jgi:mono/diheme cytochrome c family protein
MPIRGKLASFVLGALAGVVVVAGAIALLGWSAFHEGFSARPEPSALESKIAGMILHASVTDRDRGLRHGMVATPQMLAEGMEHYADHCAICHANNGSGDTMYGHGLNPRPPDLRLSATQSKSDGELYSIIRNGVRMSGMPAFGQPGPHDHGSWELVSFIRHLPALSPDDELKMQSMNPITPSEMKERQEEDEFLNGTSTATKGHSK